MTGETGGNNHANWSLGDRILQQSRKIEEYAKGREGVFVSRKTSLMIGRLAMEHRGKAVLVNAGHLLIPQVEGVGIGPGQMNGQIAGFTYSDYPTLDDGFEIEDKTGVVMVFELDKLNGVPSQEAEAWRNNVFPELDSKRFVLGMPMLEGNKLMGLSEVAGVPTTIEDLTTVQSAEIERYDYMKFVSRIHSIMNHRVALGETDSPLVEALHQELTAMNLDCPYLSELVHAQSKYIRIPKDDSLDTFNVAEGSVRGILRKFIYGPLMKNNVPVGDVQAVIYSREMADLIRQGKVTPAYADRHVSTVYIPLSIDHVLEPYAK